MKQFIYTLVIALLLGLPTLTVVADAKSDKDDRIVPQNKGTTPAMKLSANPGIDEIILSWNAVDDAIGYRLEWGETRHSLENSIVFDIDQTQYLHQYLEPETIYYYRITAKYTEKRSGKPSKIVVVKTGSIVKIKQSDVAY